MIVKEMRPDFLKGFLKKFDSALCFLEPIEQCFDFETSLPCQATFQNHLMSLRMDWRNQGLGIGGIRLSDDNFRDGQGVPGFFNL
ncbi:hypothetical protein DXT77_09255 [Pseudomonas sp. 91RF]|nr:hypothetical protein DXT77_09255 [Pseudomonas sp. 91RF]